MAGAVLNIEPSELVFRNVQYHQFYTQTVVISSTLKSSVEANLKPGSSERYSVSPTVLRLRPGESARVEVKLRVLRFAQRQKAIEKGQRDVFHIKVSPLPRMYGNECIMVSHALTRYRIFCETVHTKCHCRDHSLTRNFMPHSSSHPTLWSLVASSCLVPNLNPMTSRQAGDVQHPCSI